VGGHVKYITVRNAYNISAEKHEGKRPLGRPRRGWNVILKWIVD
jgi:hypothetical protein